MKLADPPYDEIVSRIVAHVQPRRVVLFGSRARGEARPDSDVDLVVEVEEPVGWEEAHKVRSDVLSGLGCSFDLLFFTPAEIEAQRDDLGAAIYDAVREGRQLYVRPGLPAPRWPVPFAVREPPRFYKSAADLLEQADQDLLAIELVVAAPRVPWSTVCFHAQQAAEKHFKVLLLARRRRPARTHALKELLAACRAAGDDLPGLDADCKLLTPYAVTIRYGGPPPEDVGRAAAAAGYRIVAAIRPLIDALRS